MDLGDARRAIGYFEKRLEIARETRDRRGEGNALGRLGIAYAQLGDARKAIDYYERHWRIAHEIGDRRGEGDAVGNLGIAYAQLGNLQKAIGYYKDQLGITQEIDDRRGEGNALSNLGSVYQDLGDAQEAINYFEKSLAIKRETGDRHGEAKALGNLGSIYFRLVRNVQQAISCYEEAIEIRREISDMKGLATVLFNLAQLYTQQGEFTLALPLAQEAARISNQIDYKSIAQHAQLLISHLQGESSPAPTAQENLIGMAFQAFKDTDSYQDMQVVVVQYPMLKEDRLIRVIGRIIDEQTPPKQKPVLEQRLAWLKQIVGK